MKKVHYNIPQLLFTMIQAQISVLLWGRATGKTEGPGAYFTMRNNLTMPRSMNGIVTTTYDKILTMVIPALVKGWEKFGYKQDLHYFVRKQPPAGFKFKKAFRQPQKLDHYIWWYNGSGNPLISLDRPSTSNGLSQDSLYGDEARFFHQDKIREVLLTVRGNAEHFGHLSQHGSILFTTDLPRNAKGNWLFDYEKQMGKETIEVILKINAMLVQLNQQVESASKRNRPKIEKEIARYEEDLNELRKDLVYVSYASTLDNVHALGLNVIKRFRRMLSDLDYLVSVLGVRISQIENGFYSLLDEEKHGYHANNFEFIDNVHVKDYSKGVEKNCNWDSDLIHFEPLDFACDYNAAINSMVIGQADRVINSMYVLGSDGHRLKDLIIKFDKYYSAHKARNPELNYYYDHTAVGTNASSDISFKDEIVNLLTELGWQVNDVYIGQAPSHHSKYWFWGLVLKGDDPRLPKFKYNISNCQQLIASMENAAVKQTRKGFEKDKRPEQDKNVKPEDAPHLSDALDMLWYGKYRPRLNEEPEFSATIYV